MYPSWTGINTAETRVRLPIVSETDHSPYHHVESVCIINVIICGSRSPDRRSGEWRLSLKSRARWHQGALICNLLLICQASRERPRLSETLIVGAIVITYPIWRDSHREKVIGRWVNCVAEGEVSRADYKATISGSDIWCSSRSCLKQAILRCSQLNIM